MDAIERFRQVVADPKAYARRWKERSGGPIIGTLCTYAPEELILAGGALAYRIVGGSGRTDRSDAHLQSYCCSLVRGALDDALASELDFLDGVIFPHTCDSIQRLSDIWRLNAETGFHLDVVLPVKLTTKSARVYMAAVLAEAKIRLATLLDRPITNADLERAIDTYNAIRTTMARLYALRRKGPGILSGSDMHTIVRASMTMDRSEFLEDLRPLVDSLEGQTGAKNRSGKRIFLSGGVCNLPDLFGVIEAAGGRVVGDDLCTGSRGLTGQIDTSEDPLTAITDRYMRRAICPAKHAGITRRGDELVHQAKACGAQGVIYLFLKFCDPHAFDLPYLKSMLDAAGLPSLLIELEEQTEGRGQLQTRCEAFIEML
ncbi:MAG: 2-hydroxyacyl-CoA dehydratase family protein [Desulfosarcinaceae bacterium]|nr:2-hydroxyacyl-CoA dehydratase family protein [Desulfosarcinaceae bacterium]